MYSIYPLTCDLLLIDHHAVCRLRDISPDTELTVFSYGPGYWDDMPKGGRELVDCTISLVKEKVQAVVTGWNAIDGLHTLRVGEREMRERMDRIEWGFISFPRPSRPSRPSRKRRADT